MTPPVALSGRPNTPEGRSRAFDLGPLSIDVVTYGYTVLADGVDIDSYQLIVEDADRRYRVATISSASRERMAELALAHLSDDGSGGELSVTCFAN